MNLLDMLEETDLLRDQITHIFGTYSSQIDYLGFKCSSGKMYHTGKSVDGSPFLVGKSNFKLHLLKIGIFDSGITFINTGFKETLNINIHTNYDLEVINDEFLSEAEVLIEDEEVLKNFTDQKTKKKLMLIPLVPEDEFYSRDSNDHSGDSLDFSFDSWDSDDDDFHCMVSKGFDGWENTDELQIPGAANLIMNDKDIFQCLPVDDIIYLPWDRISSRTLIIKSLLYNQTNLYSFIEKYKDDIVNELEYKKNKNLFGQRFMRNFYLCKIFQNNLEIRFYEGPQIEALDIDENIKLENELHILTEKLKIILLNSNKYDENSNYNSINNKKILPPSLQISDRWRSIAFLLINKIKHFGIHFAACVNKAIKILHSIENNFVDNSHSMAVKIKTLDMLCKIIEKKRLIPMLKNQSDFETKLNEYQSRRQTQTRTRGQTHTRTRGQTQTQKPTDEIKKAISDTKDKIKKSSLINNNEKSEELENLNTKLKELKDNKKILSNNKVNELKDQIKGVDIEKIKKDKEIKRMETKKKLVQDIKIKKQEHLEIKKNNIAPPITFSELEIPKDSEIYRSQVIVKGSEFTDPLFEPKKSSLCPVDKNGNWVPPEGITVEEDLKNWEKISWKRIDSIFGNKPYQIFDQGIESADILQGTLGDCYFLSALSDLCKYPELIQKLFFFKEKSLDRMYGINLRINGLWETVLIDDFVPVFTKKRCQLAFSRAHGNEMWVILLEKAWAKINGSYAKVIAGNPSEVFDSICNAYSEKTLVEPSAKDSIWAKIYEGVSKNYLMTAGSTSDENVDYDSFGLVPGHAYSLIGGVETKVNGETIRLVQLRNPWGETEWNGDWSDTSDKWTDEIRKNLKEENKDDGTFFMSLEDFVNYYQIIEICKIHPDFRYSYIKFNKKHTLEPQISVLNVENQTQTFIQLHQKNPRFLLSNGKYGINTSAYLLIVDEKFNYVASICGDSNNITVEADLQKGVYYVITDLNYRYINRNELHGYNFTIYSKHPISANKNEDKNLNINDILKTSLGGYFKRKYKPIKKNNLTIYEAEEIDSNLPFVGYAIENNSKNLVQVEYSYGEASSKNRNSGFYPDVNNTETDKITKKINPLDTEIFISQFHDRSKGFSLPNYRVMS